MTIQPEPIPDPEYVFVTTYWTPSCEHGSGMTAMTARADVDQPGPRCYCGAEFVQVDAPA